MLCCRTFALSYTYDVLKKALMEEFKIPEEQIAISTGSHNDLQGRDILDRQEKIRFIITVDKLREGWDCPFAYILCTISSLHSSTGVEQILGRILRMPYVTARKHDELNRAYAYATSSEFVESANALTEALVESGFQKFEAKTMVKPAESMGDEFLPLFNVSVSEAVTSKPDFSGLPKGLRERIGLREQDGQVEITYGGPPIGATDAEILRSTVTKTEDKRAVERLVRKSRGEECSPAAMGDRFCVPHLAVREEGELKLFEDQFKEVPWRLSSCDAGLTEQDFSLSREKQQIANIDVDEKGKLGWSRFLSELQKHLSLLEIHGPKNELELTNWLDQNILHPDITQTEASLFLAKMITVLITKRSLSLEGLVSNRWRLRDAAEEAIAHHRREVIDQAYQRMLLPECETPLEVDPTFCFTFDGINYPAARFYEGPVRFSKHYYLSPANMNGEEAECAAFIDALDEVEYWVRNLERNDYSFWLPTSSDKFYPDFVASLKDGRVLVVEYKGSHFAETPDTKEKDMIGRIWAERSDGRCLFITVTARDFEAIRSKLATRAGE